MCISVVSIWLCDDWSFFFFVGFFLAAFSHRTPPAGAPRRWNNPVVGGAEPKEVAELLAKELNKRLEESEEGVVQSEVLKFEHVNGFVNVFLQNEQFMDRVQLMIRKKHVTYKEGPFGQPAYSGEQEEPAFVVSPQLADGKLDPSDWVP